MRKKIRQKYIKGFTLIEVLLSMVLMVIILGSIFGFSLVATRGYMRNKAEQIVIENIRQGIEEMSRTGRMANRGAHFWNYGNPSQQNCDSKTAGCDEVCFIDLNLVNVANISGSQSYVCFSGHQTLRGSENRDLVKNINPDGRLSSWKTSSWIKDENVNGLSVTVKFFPIGYSFNVPAGDTEWENVEPSENYRNRPHYKAVLIKVTLEYKKTGSFLIDIGTDKKELQTLVNLKTYQRLYNNSN